MSWTSASAVFMTVFVLSGCTEPPLNPSLSGPVPFGTHHVDPSEGMPSAQVAGTLLLTGDCLMVNLEGRHYPLVLPDEVVWDEQAQTVGVDAVTYALDDEVSWVGAYGVARPEYNMPDACPRAAEIGIVFAMLPTAP